MTQTWWLSFCDARRPTGDQFLGAVVIEVDEEDAAAVSPLVLMKRVMHGQPPPEPEADWLAAAIVKTHQTGCNPGGEVQGMRLDHLPDFATGCPHYPRGRLLSRAEIEEWDHRPAADAVDPHTRSTGTPTTRDKESSSSS